MNENLSINKNIHPAPEICPSVLLTRDVFCAERVFLYHHGPKEHTVFLVCS